MTHDGSLDMTNDASLDLVARLFAHLDWADGRALDALRTAPDADAVRRFAHVLGAEEVWLARLEGRAAAQPVWPELDLDGCAALAEGNRARWAAYLAALTPEILARELDYRMTNGTSSRSRVSDILLHVALHGQYHRGQIALLVRAAGGEPRGTDFITFARDAGPAPVIPSAPPVIPSAARDLDASPR